ncbi:streptogrisin C [Nocardiopsis mwathae]|uniref:Streptogrisin C n=1 Tax=Nocardiopsis mwathae TaxID=1472723 RepID=A0A7W9YG38_9ACTN|nr:S1 family peptidase [Nocardiopsis mwathae]MBB6171508.1 streptogrisin C [Nocardiopsis mwathae]
MTPIPHTLRLLGAALLALATLLALAPTASADTGRTAAPPPTADDTVEIMAGNPVYGTGTRCTIGATVRTADGTGGFLTAATCGPAGATVRLSNGETGVIVWSSREDGVAFVRAKENWILTPYANRYQGGGHLTIRGSQEAPVGAAVCRSGPTTGWRCGTIQAKNQTVAFPWGAMRGLTRISACAEPGDEGGPVYRDGQLQGLIVGGSGNCRTGGTTFFKPINPILHKYNLRLVTG